MDTKKYDTDLITALQANPYYPQAEAFLARLKAEIPQADWDLAEDFANYCLEDVADVPEEYGTTPEKVEDLAKLIEGVGSLEFPLTHVIEIFDRLGADQEELYGFVSGTILDQEHDDPDFWD